MRIVGLVQTPEHVCCRYRLAPLGPVAAALGCRLELESLPPGLFSRWRLFSRLRDADLVILQRKLLPPWQLGLLRRAARRLVFDFDDAIYQRDSYDSKGPTCPMRRDRFARTVGVADAVWAGNRHLESAAQTHGGPTLWQPTCVPVDRYPLARHTRTQAVRLAWIGSSSTVQALSRRYARWLETLGKALPHIIFRIICDRFPFYQHVTVDLRTWNPQTETTDLAGSDIGLSLLPDDSWSRGKCGLKILQYFAAGLPVIANPVGVQADLVRDGENGFLVNSADELIAATRALAGDPGLRRRLGENGRKLVAAEFSLTAQRSRWRSALIGLFPALSPAASPTAESSVADSSPAAAQLLPFAPARRAA